MRTAQVYTSQLQADRPNRERLVFQQVQRALRSLAAIDCRDVGERRTGRPSPPPGLTLVEPSAAVIAMGHVAHVALCDMSKHTLVARAFDPEDLDEDSEDDIGRLVWSSVNTMRMVAVGEPAWQSTQLLPVVERCFHDVPPLPMAEPDIETPGVLVIDHAAAAARTRELVEILERAMLRVKCIDFAGKAHGVVQPDPWADTSWIHVHVGEHTLKSERPRLVDSWHGGRLTIHLRASSDRALPGASADCLAINDQENGFVCSTPTEVAAVCRDLLNDADLRHKILTIGRDTAAPLAGAWRSIAQDLLP